MRRVLAVLVILLVIPVAASAVSLRDYKKDGKHIDTLVCDGGKTTVRGYSSPPWRLDEITTSSGRMLFIMNTKDGQLLFVKEPGAKEAKEYAFEGFGKGFDKILEDEAPMLRAMYMQNPGDCKGVRAIEIEIK